MILDNNLELNDYLRRLLLKVYACNKFDDIIQQYAETRVNPNVEKDILNKMDYLNIDIKTLEEDLNLFTNNPFVKDISIPEVTLGNISCRHVTIPKEALIITDNVFSKDDEFKFYRKLGYYKSDVKIPVLFEKERLWMSPTLLEQRSMEEAVEKSKGDVLIFGLGMGYYPYMCIQKENVTSITIIEKDQEIIDFFNLYIKKNFPDNKQLKIINGDMYNYYNHEFLKNYNYIFIDTYEGFSDGLSAYMKLKIIDTKDLEISFWLEGIFIQTIKNNIILYLSSLKEGRYYQTLMSSSEPAFTLLKKIHKYFRSNNTKINTPNDLKSILTSNRILFDILKINI